MPLATTLTFILGGSRSGKSKRAESLALEDPRPVCYIATYRTAWIDVEMTERIALHRSRRPDHWTTIENRSDLAEILLEHRGSLILLDCLTLWISGLMCDGHPQEVILSRIDSFHDSLRSCPGTSAIIVSNEVGCGIVPEHPETRKFRDLCGFANQKIASLSDRMEWVVAGISTPLKPNVLAGRREDPPAIPLK